MLSCFSRKLKVGSSRRGETMAINSSKAEISGGRGAGCSERLEETPPRPFHLCRDFARRYDATMARDETQAAKRMEQLREEIRKHDRLYYEQAAPVISDREYDRLYKALVDIETQFPELVTPDAPTQRPGWQPLNACHR